MRDLNVTSLPAQMRIAASSQLTWLVVALLGYVLCADNRAFAQGHNQAGPVPAGMQPPGMMPPGGMRPGMGPGPTGAQQPWVPGRPDPKGPVPEMKPIDSVTLPNNFKPPAVKPELMDIDQPLLLFEDAEKLKREYLGKYQNSLRAARPANEEDKLIIRNGLKYRLAVMCLKKNRPDLGKYHEELIRDLNMAASVPVNANPAAIRTFRQSVLQELISQAAPLLATQNFYVRLHFTILLGELNLTEESSKFNLKLESFAPACDPLVQVILDPAQPEAVKIAAVNGLARILRLGNPDVGRRTAVANALVAELKKPFKPKDPGVAWYQMRLVGALAVVDIVDLDQARKPFVVDILKSVMGDDTREWAVRAEAAKSLGRVTLPTAVSPPTVTRAVADFALKLANEAKKSPQQRADDPKWKGEFIKVYLAFQPLDANDLTANKSGKAGLLNNAAANAKPAYDLVIPLVVAILRGQRLTVQQVQPLETYVGPASVVNPPVQSSNEPKSVKGTDAKTSESTVPMSLNASGPK